MSQLYSSNGIPILKEQTYHKSRCKTGNIPRRSGYRQARQQRNQQCDLAICLYRNLSLLYQLPQRAKNCKQSLKIT